MTYKTFEKLMKEFIEIKDEVERINDINHKSFLNESNWSYPLGNPQLESLFIKAIEEALDDKYGYLGYWIYECNCGKDKNMNKKIQHANGKYVKFKTLKDLYNLIK